MKRSCALGLLLLLLPIFALAEGYDRIFDTSDDAGKLTARFISMDTGTGEKAGDCAILTSPDGLVMVIDAGHPDAADDMLRALDAMGVKDIDLLVLSHPHIDHVGVGTPMHGDAIYNGAHDNASGVAAVLQIMKAFVASGATPERTIVFAFWDGEEFGLLGSRYFTDNYKDMQNVKGYLNFDMVGSGTDSRYLMYFFTAAHPKFGEWLKADMAKHNFCFDPDYRAWENPVGGSDQQSFHLKGVPIVWYHTGGQPNYNFPSDEADTVNYPKLTDITRASYLTTWHLANEAEY